MGWKHISHTFIFREIKLLPSQLATFALVHIPVRIIKMYPQEMMHEPVWFDRQRYEAEEDHYQLYLTSNLSLELSSKTVQVDGEGGGSSISKQIAKARDNIKQTLSGQVAGKEETQSNIDVDLVKENSELRKLLEELRCQVAALDTRVKKLEEASSAPAKPEPAKEAAPAKKEDDSDGDNLFSDDSDEEEEEEDEATKARREKLLAAYAAKKAKKPCPIAKSSLLIDVKPWDDETDMQAIEDSVRGIVADGLLWGASKLIPVGYGIKKLQISAVIEDDKISTDWLDEEITKFEDLVQSMDIAAFNKI